MATHVLVHGGGHGGWCYRKTELLLRAAGHDMFRPTLTGLAAPTSSALTSSSTSTSPTWSN